MSASSQKYVPPALRHRQGISSEVASGPAPDLVGQIMGLLRQLNDKPEPAIHSQLFRQLHALLSDDGRALFDYYAMSFSQVAKATGGMMKEYAPRLKTLWFSAGVQKTQRSWWTEQTKALKTQLDEEDHKALLHLVMASKDQVQPFSIYCTNMKWAASKDAQGCGICNKTWAFGNAWYELDLTKLPQHDLWEKGLFKKRAGCRTITSTLLEGPLPDATDFSSAIDGILAGIQARIDRNPKLLLQGRIDEVRINFDPKASDVTSINARLQTICHRGGLTKQTKYDQDDPRETCEWLLGALVHWNTTDFADIPGALVLSPELIPKKQAEAHTLHQANCLTWLGLELEKFDDITHAKRQEVVSFIMDKLRSHVLKVAASGAELSAGAKLIIANLRGEFEDYHGQPSYAWKWSLMQGKDCQQGFAGYLWRCFDREHLTSAEYEDLLEQQLHKLRQRAEGTKVPSEDGDFLQLEKCPDQDDL